MNPETPKDSQPIGAKRVNLKTLAEYLDLSPATISLVLNQSPVAKSIPLVTRQRVIAAAKKFNYHPNQLARSLRMSRTHTVGIIAPEHSDGYFTSVMMGVETFLIQAGYLYFTVSHFGKKDLLEEYPRLLLNRHVDGFLLINTRLDEDLGIPTVAISGHSRIPGVSNILIDHDHAAVATLKHLHDLGHRRVAFMKGQPNALDAEPRWKSLMAAAQAASFPIDPQLCLSLELNSWSPDLGYPIVMDLLRKTRNFTALVCFNDLAAIGAIRAIADCSLSCPTDLSVVGFDDIASAGYCIPRLTTVRQPLEQMGAAAAGKLIERIESSQPVAAETMYFEPELMVRESTGISSKLRRPARK